MTKSYSHYLLIFVISLECSSALNIQKEIIMDMMGSSNSNCQPSPGTFSTSFAYESSQATSDWNPDLVNFEEDLFVAKLQHSDTNNTEQEWTIRVGQGGNIYSFYGPMGETVPPQRGTNSPWVDEVWQQVSPLGSGGDNDNDPNTDLYFIHEAGAYTRDSPYTDTPFFSPTLGKYCDDEAGECGFLSWGAQAHVPTNWESPMIYINRYSDCGDGVMEHTSARHSNGDVYCGNAICPFDYKNVPWGGTRSTVLPDVVMTNSDNTMDHVFPIGSWGSTEEVDSIKPLSATAGYTIFTEGIYHPDDGNDYTIPNNAEYVFKNSCRKTTFHSDRDGQLVVVCDIEDTNAASNSETQYPIRLETDNDCTIAMYRVLHFAYNGNTFYFYPETESGETETDTIERINDCFTPGTRVVGSYIHKPGKEVSLSLAHVHGIGAYSTHGSYPRVRAGYSPSTSRQYNVYTVNDLTAIYNGDTFIANQYFIMDNYESVQSQGPTWSVETSYIVKGRDDYSSSARTINLFKTVDGETFGATIGSTSCGEIEPACAGFTTPTIGTKALFSVQCGATKVITTDPYYFSPQESTIRAYICEGLATTERPQWSLLGFFEEDACGNSLDGLDYDPQLCESPIQNSSETPTQIPTESPTHYPTQNPTTQNPTMNPTTQNPTQNPTTQNPTMNPTTQNPTMNPTTQNPTMNPTTQNPTMNPTTQNPTMNPTTQNPTMNPTTQNPTTQNPTTEEPTPTMNTSANPTMNPMMNTSANPTMNPTNDSEETCVDSPLKIVYNNNEFSCLQVRDYCSNEAILTHCPFTCEACSDYGCLDSELPFAFGGNRGGSAILQCDEISSSEQFEQMCNNFYSIRATCKTSCNFDCTGE